MRPSASAVLLIGLSVYVVAGALCALAPDPTVLIGMLVVQGLAGAAGIVIARAVVRDLYDGLGAARPLFSLMLVSGTAPILAPVLGAQLLRVTSCRGVFVTLTVLGLVVLAATAALLSETLPTYRRCRGGLPDTLRTMRDLITDSRFTGCLLTGSLAFAALFAYIAGSRERQSQGIRTAWSGPLRPSRHPPFDHPSDRAG